MLREIAVNEFSTLRWNLQQDVVKYASQGIQKIGLSRSKVSDFGVEAAIDLLFEMDMGVSSVNWAGGFTGSDGRTFLDAIDDAKNAIYLASQVQADCLIVHSGGMNNHTDRHAHRIFEHALDALLPVAEDYGVKLAIEPMQGADSQPWSILNSIDQTIDYVDRYDCDKLGLVLDLFHCGLHKDTLATFQANAEKIFLIQLADRDCVSKGQRRMLGAGAVDIQGWLDGLKMCDVRCPVELEIYGECNREISYEDRLQAFDQFIASPKIGGASSRSLPQGTQASRN